jgi:hypothetical protein
VELLVALEMARDSISAAYWTMTMLRRARTIDGMPTRRMTRHSLIRDDHWTETRLFWVEKAPMADSWTHGHICREDVCLNAHSVE